MSTAPTELIDDQGRLVKSYAVDPFTEIEVEGSASVFYRAGTPFVLTIAAAAADHERIIVRMGDEIHVEWNGGLVRGRQPSLPMAFTFVSPTLDEIRLGDDITANFDAFEARELSVEVGRKGIVDFANVTLGELEVQLGSGSSMTIRGEAKKQEITAEQGARYDATGLASDQVKAEARDGATVLVQAGKKLAATASNGGTVIYSGSPSELQIEAADNGTVRQG